VAGAGEFAVMLTMPVVISECTTGESLSSIAASWDAGTTPVAGLSSKAADAGEEDSEAGGAHAAAAPPAAVDQRQLAMEMPLPRWRRQTELRRELSVRPLIGPSSSSPLVRI
jgi:hypothetical protein